MRISSFAGLGKGVGILLSVLLIAMPALAQVTPEQAQPEKVISDTEQGQTEKTWTDAELGAVEGMISGKGRASGKEWQALGGLFGIGLPFGGSKIFKKNSVLGSCLGDVSISGCLYGSMASILLSTLGFINSEHISPSFFIGKSPEYIAAYQKAFRRGYKSKQVGNYLIGNLAALCFVVIPAFVGVELMDYK